VQRQHPYEDDVAWYADRAAGLRSVSPELSDDDARQLVAQRHGLASWDALCGEVERQARAAPGPFMQAFRALRWGDRDELERLVDGSPWLVEARGSNGNDLLGLATSLDHGGRRGLVETLLRRGADPASGNDHGWAPLHQAASRNDLPLVELLLAAGAPLDACARGDGGTPLAAALFWGQREAAEVLAVRAVVPRNLRIAGGLGRRDLIDELVDADGRLRPAAGEHRAFHRPHGGFPRWEPRPDEQEVLDEALVWAAKTGGVETIDRLVELGADVDGDPYRGTPLTWAAARGRVEAIDRLVALGADPNRQATFGGPQHGEGVTALHIAAQAGQEAAVERLLRLGADPTIRDRLYHGPASGWADQGGNAALRERLLAAEAARRS
jgi:ankyrin repeat protein